MATRQIVISDFTGEPVDDGNQCQLIVHAHPGYRATSFPVTLDCTPSELEKTASSDLDVVEIELVGPDGPQGRIAMAMTDFDQLVTPDHFQELIIAQRRDRRAGNGQAPPATTAPAAKRNYQSLEHAGEPHRGKITETEKDLVREHLEEVNQRLEADGYRIIDPADPKLAARYGL